MATSKKKSKRSSAKGAARVAFSRREKIVDIFAAEMARAIFKATLAPYIIEKTGLADQLGKGNSAVIFCKCPRCSKGVHITTSKWDK